MALSRDYFKALIQEQIQITQPEVDEKIQNLNDLYESIEVTDEDIAEIDAIVESEDDDDRNQAMADAGQKQDKYKSPFKGLSKKKKPVKEEAEELDEGFGNLSVLPSYVASFMTDKARWNMGGENSVVDSFTVSDAAKLNSTLNAKIKEISKNLGRDHVQVWCWFNVDGKDWVIKKFSTADQKYDAWWYGSDTRYDYNQNKQVAQPAQWHNYTQGRRGSGQRKAGDMFNFNGQPTKIVVITPDYKRDELRKQRAAASINTDPLNKSGRVFGWDADKKESSFDVSTMMHMVQPRIEAVKQKLLDSVINAVKESTANIVSAKPIDYSSGLETFNFRYDLTSQINGIIGKLKNAEKLVDKFYISERTSDGRFTTSQAKAILKFVKMWETWAARN